MTYPAALYAGLHRGNAGDVEFYRNECRGARSVLELGCGYGRMLDALAEVVATCWGVDEHQGLLDLARHTTGAKLVRGPMQRCALGRRFDRVLIPYNGLYCLLTDDDVAACLANARRHLEVDGRLIFDVYPYEGPADLDLLQAVDEDLPLVQVFDGDRSYTVYESAALDGSMPEVVRVTYRYEPDDGGPAVWGSIAQRAMTKPHLESLLRRVGFEVERWAGGFFGEPDDDDAEQWVVVAKTVDGLDGPEGSSGTAFDRA